MSSSLIFETGFGNSRQRSRWWRDGDGSYATTAHDEGEDLRVIYDLTDYLASSETVSSAAYSDEGLTTSSKSVSTPQVLFTITGFGSTKVTVTLSTGREHVVRFRVYQESASHLIGSDYGNR